MGLDRRDRIRLALQAALFLGAAQARAQSTHDLEFDWSNVQNPNGVWSYNHSGGGLIAANWPNWAAWNGWGNGSGIPAWAPDPTLFGYGYAPAWFQVALPPPSPFYDMPIGSIVGANTDGNVGVEVTWTCPVAGSYAAHFEVWFAAGTDPAHEGRSANWYVFSKDVQLTTGHVGWGEGFTSWSPATFDLADSFAAGDVVRLDVVRDPAGTWGSLYGARLTVGPAPESYCTAGTSASGCQASLSSVGLPSATASSGFDLIASSVEGAKDGLFYFGINGRQANPWGNGTSYQCVVPPVKRAGIIAGAGAIGACDGAFAQDLNALWCSTCPKPGHNPGSGAVVQAQLWYRDPLSTSNQTTSLSDALEFVLAP
jgi:hypothetical protein